MTWREDTTEGQGEGPTCPMLGAARRDGKCSIIGNHGIPHPRCTDGGEGSLLTKSTNHAYLFPPHVYKGSEVSLG